jgi:hemolysin activation/secretion protein
VRGFNERIITGDRGWRLGLELFTPELGNHTGLEHASLRLLGFLDAGQVDRLQPQPGETPHHAIASAGIGARFGLEKHLNVRVDYGHVLSGDADADVKSGASRFHASVSYIF